VLTWLNKGFIIIIIQEQELQLWGADVLYVLGFCVAVNSDSFLPWYGEDHPFRVSILL